MSHFFQATWLHTSIYSHKRSSGRNGWAPALVRCCWLLLRLLTKWCHPVISWFINHSKYRYIYHKAYLLDLQTNLPKYGAPPCKDCFLIPKKKTDEHGGIGTTGADKEWIQCRILHHDVKHSRCVERCGAWQVATYFRRVQVDLIYIVTL